VRGAGGRTREGKKLGLGFRVFFLFLLTSIKEKNPFLPKIASFLKRKKSGGKIL